jgi:hypothetical protein
MKLSKVRTLDYRDPAKAESQATNADRWVAGYSLHALRRIANDLSGDACQNPRDPRHRWLQERKAAVMRRLEPASVAVFS